MRRMNIFRDWCQNVFRATDNPYIGWKITLLYCVWDLLNKSLTYSIQPRMMLSSALFFTDEYLILKNSLILLVITVCTTFNGKPSLQRVVEINLIYASSIDSYIYIYTYIYWERDRERYVSSTPKKKAVIKLATIVEGDPKAPFSIATTPRCRGGRYSIPRIAPLYPWTVPYNAEC